MRDNNNATAHRADEYDDQILKTIPCYDKFHEQVIELISSYMPDPERWVDTGCGTGNLVRKCVDKFQKTNFILSDCSQQMLQIAKEKLVDYKSRVQILEPATTQELKIASQADVITAIQVHHYLSAPERKKAVDTCYRLLHEGGIFISFENISPETKIGIEIGKKIWGNYQLAHGKSQQEVDTHLDRFGKQYYPITVSEHFDLYKQCGFKVVEFLWYSYMQAGFYCIK